MAFDRGGRGGGGFGDRGGSRGGRGGFGDRGGGRGGRGGFGDRGGGRGGGTSQSFYPSIPRHLYVVFPWLGMPTLSVLDSRNPATAHFTPPTQTRGSH
jgi:hypothetical protein